MILKPLDTHANWRRKDVEDESRWTLVLTDAEKEELDRALKTARARSEDLLEIGVDDFPLPSLSLRLADIERELIDGRGFVRIGTLGRDRYSNDEMTRVCRGIGLHLGDPWPQNKHGHMMGDVTDQGKLPSDPAARGNELGQIALEYHTDGSDLVGLMCLHPAKSGGLSCVANVVTIYNQTAEPRPGLLLALFEALPWDFRGEEPGGGRPYYMRTMFTEHGGRLFRRFVPPCIKSSQRHADAPRLPPDAIEALDLISEPACRPEFNAYMNLRPGEMQFINNYHVLHACMAYEDDVPAGIKRHLERLWLSTRYLMDRPPTFDKQVHDHWASNRSVSRLPA